MKSLKDQQIDVIIVSYAQNDGLKEITQRCITTAIETTKIQLNIIVLEQNNKVIYNRARTINYNFKFNYNKVLNYGISLTRNKYILLANNDLIFYNNWAEELINCLGNKYLSCSAFSEINPHKHEYNYNTGNYKGYNIGHELLGWCIFVKRELFNTIGKLDESYTFWSSDNAYAEQLKINKIEHILCTSARIDHVTSATLQQNNRIELTHNQHSKFMNDLKYKTTFSVIMASYLGVYPRCASNREEKFIRAVKSVQAQTFKNWELIIVSDGCDITVRLYLENFADDKRIKCVKIPKQTLWSGNVRYAGQKVCNGRYVCYLDSDDYFNENHLELIKNNIHSLDWAYMSEYALTNEGLKERDVKLELSSSGTSSVVHRSSMSSTWKGCDNHCHDWLFIQKLMAESTNYDTIGRCGYVVCHTQWSFDN